MKKKIIILMMMITIILMVSVSFANSVVEYENAIYTVKVIDGNNDILYLYNDSYPYYFFYDDGYDWMYLQTDITGHVYNQTQDTSFNTSAIRIKDYVEDPHCYTIIENNHTLMYGSEVAFAPFIPDTTIENLLTLEEKNAFYSKYKNQFSRIYITRSSYVNNDGCEVIDELMYAHNGDVVGSKSELMNYNGSRFAYKMAGAEHETYTTKLVWCFNAEKTVVGYPKPYSFELIDDELEPQYIQIEKNNIYVTNIIDDDTVQIINVVGQINSETEPELSLLSEYSNTVINSNVIANNSGYEFNYEIQIDTSTAYTKDIVAYVNGLSVRLNFTDCIKIKCIDK